MSTLLEQASLVMIPSGYKEDVVYSQIPTNGNGDLSFTRASNGTRINSAGLVEDCPWNLLQQSETFSNAYWTKSNTTISADTTTAPNGTLTADKLMVNTTNDYHRIAQTLSSQSANHTISIYAKKGELNFIQLAFGNNVEQYANFDLNTGVVGTKGSYCASSSITNVGDGWYRCTAYINQGTVPTLFIYVVNSASSSWGGVVPWVGANNTDGIYIWGAQLVEGSTAKPYFPTTDRLNVPRLTYQNGGGGCPSLLLEPQRTNIALRSEEFDNASSWTLTNSGTITANSTISPDGTQTADTLNAGANFAQVQQAVTGTSGAVYTVSIWIKRITGTGNVFLRAVENADTLIAVTSDWQRFTATVTSTTTTIRIGVKLATSGDAVAIWGGQIEAGAYPTTYIPTTSATATRVADSFSRNNIYTNGLITSSGGTWFVELLNNVAYQRDANNGVFLGDNTSINSDNQFTIRNGIASGVGRLNIFKYISGVSTSLFTLYTNTVKIAIKWNGSTADVFVNGIKEVSATAFTTTNMQNLIGSGAGVPIFIQQMALSPSPLSDTDCQALTTI